jgi:hypothetical protein
MLKNIIASSLIALFISAISIVGCVGSRNTLESKSILLKKDSLTQNGKCTIVGKVIDIISKEEIIGAVVELVSPKVETRTDLDGNYIFSNLTTGEYNIKIRLPGYKSKTVTNFKIESGQLVTLNFELERQPIEPQF